MPPDLIPKLDESTFAHVMRDKRKLWRPIELAEALGLGKDIIYQLIETGELEAHVFGKRTGGFRPRGTERAEDLFGATPQRKSGTRITRRSVLRYIQESATYDLTAIEWAEYLSRLVPNLPTNVLEVTRQKISQVIATRGL